MSEPAFDGEWGTPTYAEPARTSRRTTSTSTSTRPAERIGGVRPAVESPARAVTSSRTSPSAGLRVSRAPRVPFAVLLVGLLVGGMSLLLLLNTASAANELQRHDLATQDAGVAAQVEQLQNDVAASAAPGNLARVAQGLGMVPAGNPAFLVVGPDGKVVVRGSAAPASQAPVAVPKATATSTKKPTATKSTAKKPTATKPTAKKPTTKKSAATKSTAKKPTAKKSTGATPSPAPSRTSTGANR